MHKRDWIKAAFMRRAICASLRPESASQFEMDYFMIQNEGKDYDA